MSILKLKPITKDTVLVAIYYMIDFMHYQSNIARFFLLIIHKQIELNLSVAKQALVLPVKKVTFQNWMKLLKSYITRLSKTLMNQLSNTLITVPEMLLNS